MTEKKQEANIENIIKKRRTPVQVIKDNPIILDLIIILAVIILIAGILYYQNLQSKIYIENSEINAPIISLNSPIPGILEKINVQEGDYVSKSRAVAIVNNNPIYPKTNGIVVGVNNIPGKFVTSQDTLVQMIDPKELRVIGHIQEDKGLKDIEVGQHVIFTVDAFGNKKYEGFVDSIAETPQQSDIVFSISNQRQEKEFDIKVSFDINKYPELKNGMSARMWIYK